MNEKTSPLGLLVVWAIVGIPLLWGIVETLGKAANLFK